MLRATSIVAILGVAHAAYDKCDRPVAQWAGVNQARGPHEHHSRALALR